MLLTPDEIYIRSSLHPALAVNYITFTYGLFVAIKKLPPTSLFNSNWKLEYGFKLPLRRYSRVSGLNISKNQRKKRRPYYNCLLKLSQRAIALVVNESILTKHFGYVHGAYMYIIINTKNASNLTNRC